MSTDRTPIDRAAGWFRGWRPFPTGASPDDLATNEDREAAREVLSAALTNDADPDWLAKAIDPEAFEDHPIEQRRPIAAIQWAARRKFALDAAASATAAILGADQ